MVLSFWRNHLFSNKIYPNDRDDDIILNDESLEYFFEKKVICTSDKNNNIIKKRSGREDVIDFNANGQKKYEGKFNRKYSGLGRYYYFKEGVKYVGYFKNGKRCGKGILYSSSLSESYNDDDKKIIYEGQWKNDLKHGIGILYYKNKKIQYDGEWKNGRKHGDGQFFEPNGKKLYNGEWKNDQYRRKRSLLFSQWRKKE